VFLLAALRKVLTAMGGGNAKSWVSSISGEDFINIF